MKHIHNLTDAQLDTPSIVAIGNFDGVHRGHQQLINHQVQQARAQGRRAVVLTFFPHPKRLLSSNHAPFYLTHPDVRARLLHGLGVDLVVTQPFDTALRETRAAIFVDQMLCHLNMRALWVGKGFALGYQREGDVPFLTALGAARGFNVRTVDMLMVGTAKISSSSIREALRRGAVEQAARDLGRLYRLDGQVVQGLRRGHTLGFPTANLAVWEERLIPAPGVYAGWAWVDGVCYAAVTNIGVRPTFSADAGQTIEVHLLDFDRDIYGQEIGFEFAARLRGEERFDGPEALVMQVRKDVEQARAFLRVAECRA